MAQFDTIFAKHNTDNMKDIVRMSDLHFSSSLFENYRTGTVLDKLLCSYSGLPKGVNYFPSLATSTSFSSKVR